MWLSNRLAASPAPWKLVATHHAPYSSSGSAAAARWPYAEWGADIVLAGHSHNYERIEQDGFVYIVNGVGGAPLLGIDSPMPGSRVHFDDRYGAMLAIANEQEITFEFYSTEDAVVRDRFSLQRAQLNITWAEGGVDLVWPAQGTDRLRLESLRTGNWAIVTNTPVIRGSQKVVTVPLRTTREFFRLRAP